ncbi:Alpha-tocopherol transfer protein-like [Pseudolycoriella hygida]|uniref:Alpha-tocopherol transfer protein-like n=1 Tax=Pseudolycoriella hygida TaxID=35572 RepID=A0A9Q0S1Z6_9DIPT|nr:Alpha-tocopherol transfer protein-like [Pseudolycoriella hygida]
METKIIHLSSSDNDIKKYENSTQLLGERLIDDALPNQTITMECSTANEFEQMRNRFRALLSTTIVNSPTEITSPNQTQQQNSQFVTIGTSDISETTPPSIEPTFHLRHLKGIMSGPAIRPLNSDLQTVAKQQLFEEPEKIQENLEAFREWIRKSAHLRSRMDDQFLVTFLRGCKYSLEMAKKKLDMFYTLRTHIPEMITARDPLDQKLHRIIKMGVGLPLPKTETPGSPRLMLMRAGIYDASEFTMQEVMKVTTMINDIIMIEDDNSIVAGQIGIIDMKNVTIAHFMQMQPSLMKKMTMLFQEGMPVRQKGVHYINAPSTFEKVFNVFKTFLNDKMKSRLYVHSSMESLYKVVPRKLMPAEYEGEGPPLQEITDVWEKKILTYRDYLLQDNSLYGVDEKKRIGQPKNSSSLFGLEGSFRQLDFD